MSYKENCPLCGIESWSDVLTMNGTNVFAFRCPNCGNFEMLHKDPFWLGRAIGKAVYDDETRYNLLDSDEDYQNQLFILSSYVSQLNEKMEADGNKHSILIDYEFIKDALNSSTIPRTPEQKIDAILEYVNNKSKYYSNYVPITSKVIFSKYLWELKSLISELRDAGYIQIQRLPAQYDAASDLSQLYHVSITLKGIAYLKERKNTILNNTCFVAMWFDPSMDKIMDEVFQPACEEAGYNPIRVDRVQFNGDITDRIIADIKESSFVIADLTGFRGGVYYEAGFAKGLGKEVILCCKKDYEIQIKYPGNENLKSEKGPHFDVNHLNTITWEDDKLTEFRQKLIDRITATVGRGNNKKG